MKTDKEGYPFADKAENDRIIKEADRLHTTIKTLVKSTKGGGLGVSSKTWKTLDKLLDVIGCFLY